MTKCKATIFGDDVITATKMAAVATRRSGGAVIEDAARSCLGKGLVRLRGSICVRFSTGSPPRGASDLADVEAIEVAVGEVAGAGRQGWGWRGASAVSPEAAARRESLRREETLSTWRMPSGQLGE